MKKEDIITNKKNISYDNTPNTKLEKDFAEIREKLLDLSMRNQLINFRARSRSVEVIDDYAENIYEYLVLKEKKMQFLPRRNKLNLFSDSDSEEAKVDNDSYDDNSKKNNANLPLNIKKETNIGNNSNAKIETITQDNLDNNKNEPLDEHLNNNQTSPILNKETNITLSNIKTEEDTFNSRIDSKDYLKERKNNEEIKLHDKQVKLNGFINEVNATYENQDLFIENTNENLNLDNKTKIIDNNHTLYSVKSEEVIDDYHDDLDSSENVKFYSDKKEKLWEMPDISLNVINEHRRRYLKTRLSPSELQRRLFYINQRAMTTLQEQGHNILYLALGFLEWYDEEKHPNDPKLAPLILVPVLIERRNIGKSFYIQWDGQDILTNLSLQMKFKREMDIELPSFNMPQNTEGITEYINQIKEVISYIPKWKIHDKIQLGFFSFSKFVMYQDLNIEHTGLDISKKPLIKQMFPNENSNVLIDEPLLNIEDEYKINQNNVKNLKYENTYNVLDADSSQMDVIEYVKSGHNLVVDGPPGTGKSQTIVNLIAELMASGKTVLFVSEKMAALEVVKSRLDNIGLGKFCLELHSHKTRKRDVLKDLENSLKDTHIENIDIERDINRAETLKKQLNSYNEALHEPIYNINKSPFELIGLKETAEKRLGEIPYVAIPNPSDITPLNWEKSLLELENLSKLSQLLPPITNNPWRGTKPHMIIDRKSVV